MEKCRLYLVNGVCKFIDEKGELCPLTEMKAKIFLTKQFRNTNFMSDEAVEILKTFLREKTNMIENLQKIMRCVCEAYGNESKEFKKEFLKKWLVPEEYKLFSADEIEKFVNGNENTDIESLTLVEMVNLVGKMADALKPFTLYGEGGFYDQMFDKLKQEEKSTLSNKVSSDTESVKQGIVDNVIHYLSLHYLSLDSILPNDETLRTMVNAFSQSKFKISKEDVEDAISKIKIGLMDADRPIEQYFSSISTEESKQECECNCIHHLDSNTDREVLRNLMHKIVRTTSSECTVYDLAIMNDCKERKVYKCKDCGKIYTEEEIRILIALEGEDREVK